MLYAQTVNGSVGHVITSQSNEDSTVTTVCGKTLNAREVNMVDGGDVCKACDNKVEVPEPEAVEEVVTTTPIKESKSEGKAAESKDK